MTNICSNISAEISKLPLFSSASGTNFAINLFNNTIGTILINEYCVIFNKSALDLSLK